MTECDNHDEQSIVLDEIDDPIVSDAYAETLTTAKGFCTRRPRIDRQERDRAPDACLVLSVNAFERT